jgi:hypothetical protein
MSRRASTETGSRARQAAPAALRAWDNHSRAAPTIKESASSDPCYRSSIVWTPGSTTGRRVPEAQRECHHG